jgi:hypothetical protein
MKTSRTPNCVRVKIVLSPHTTSLCEKVQEELRMIERLPGVVPQTNIGGFPPRTFVTDKV